MVPSLKPSLPVEEVVGPLMLLLVEEVAVVQMHLQALLRATVQTKVLLLAMVQMKVLLLAIWSR